MARDVTVEVGSGRIRGVESRGVASFLGIPYGRPPVGPRRFMAPEPASPWPGTRDATVFGPAALQLDLRLVATGAWADVLALTYPRCGTPLEGGPASEDCLFLNVWAPDPREGSGPLPVMIWLHGGAFTNGHGAETMFHGDALAGTGDAVIVTLNHRLGLLGFLPLGTLLPERYPHAGVAGMMDIVLALQWVRANIAQFGGDPGNVTVFGQSGGGAKALTLLTMPSAQPLFHKAIVQSVPWLPAQAPEKGERYVRALLKDFELSAGELQDLPAEHLMEALAAYQAKPGDDEGNRPGQDALQPTIDGSVLPGQPFGNGPPASIAQIPLLVGSNTHDTALMLCGQPEYAALTSEQELGRQLEQRFGADAGPLHGWAQSRQPAESPRLRLARIESALSFGRVTDQLAEHKAAQPAPVYRYEFGYETPALQGRLGACHSLEIPFLFRTVERIPVTGDRPDRHEVSDLMSRAWLAFARTGNPGHDRIPCWPRYQAGQRQSMRIGATWAAEAADRPPVDHQQPPEA